MLKKILICGVLLISNLGCSAEKAEKGNAIAILNVEKLRLETKAGKSVAQQITDLQNKLQDKFTKMQKDFDAKKADLDKQKSVLSADAFAKKEADFNNSISDARKDIQKEVANIEQMQQTAFAEFDTVAFSVVESIAKEEGYLQVFPINFLVYMDPKSDITSQVITGVDKKLENIALKTPTQTPAQPTK